MSNGPVDEMINELRVNGNKSFARALKRTLLKIRESPGIRHLIHNGTQSENGIYTLIRLVSFILTSPAMIKHSWVCMDGFTIGLIAISIDSFSRKAIHSDHL